MLLKKLKEYLPSNYGMMPVQDVLNHLKQKTPSTFQKIDSFVKYVNSSSELSDKLSDEWKVKGNDAFKKAQYEQAIEDYSRGILCAASRESLTALINNRSTAFYKLKRYTDSCLDAHRCLSIQPKYWKALLRRGTALQQLGFAKEGERDVKAAEAEDLSLCNTDADLEPIIGTLFKGMASSSIPPRAHFGIGVKVERSSKRSSLVAVEKLQPGSEVLEETPCACIAGLDNLLSTCCFCLQHTTCLYQSEDYRAAGRKSRGLFCSEDCGSAAWKHYGAIETENAFFICCPDDVLLAHRFLQGMQEFAIGEGLRSNSKVSSPLEGYLGDMENLRSDISKEIAPEVTVGGYETLASVMGLYMGAFTAHMAELIRKAQRQILLHAIEVKCQVRFRRAGGEGEDNATREIFSTTTVIAGRAIYATGTFFAHSCNPNCFLSFKENPQGCCAQVAVRVIRPVMPGETLTIAYGGITRFHSHSKNHRIQLLRKQYGFICQCVACTDECDEVIPFDVKEHYIKAADYYQKGCRLIREKQYTTAVTVLLQSYEIVMRFICSPPRPPLPMLPPTHRSLALAYFHLNNRPKCLEHLKAALSIDIQLHGDDNWAELIQDYNRLSSVAIDPEEKREYAFKAIALLERFYTPSTTLSVTVKMMKSALPADSSPLNVETP